MTDIGIDPLDVLKCAHLPSDLFARNDYTLSAPDYFSLWRGLEIAGKNKQVPLLLAEHMSAEAFDPPIFASLCSPNFLVAMQRLSTYKPLIGPMRLDVQTLPEHLLLTVECYGNTEPLPNMLSLCEAIFFVRLAQIGTREAITPSHVILPELPKDITPYRAFFQCDITQGAQMSIQFTLTDALQPFLTSSGAMWDFFEDKLNRKLSELSATASTYQRVRAVLLETLPSGESHIEAIAKQLAMSKRTLQRKLANEQRSFQDVLLSVRTELAKHYLAKSQISLAEISFLLGFKESSSFNRAFHEWCGLTPGQFRQSHTSLATL